MYWRRRTIAKISAWTLGLTALVVPLIVAIALSTAPNNALFATGSSSVLPLMIDFSKNYTASELIPTGGGSGKGLNDIANGWTDFGDMSANKKSDIVTDAVTTQKWKEHRNKTITICFDGIGIMVKLPQGLMVDQSHLVTDPAQKKGEKYYPVLNPACIVDIYSSSNTLHNVKWSQLVENRVDPQNPLWRTNVTGFGRTGGASASGTAEGFFQVLQNFDTNDRVPLDKNHSKPWIKKTPESNAQAYQRLNAAPEGITYLSLGYANVVLGAPGNNTAVSFIDTKQFLKIPGSPWQAPTIPVIQKKRYGWKRPFNTAFSLVEAAKNPRILDFVRWALQHNGQQIAQKLFLVPLSKEQSEEQLNLLKLSDFDLLKSHNKQYRQWAFGAQN